MAGDHKAMLGVRLILPLGVKIKEHGTVSIEDGRDANALLFVLVVFLVFVLGMKPKSTKATAYGFLKSIVISLRGNTILLIGPE